MIEIVLTVVVSAIVVAVLTWLIIKGIRFTQQFNKRIDDSLYKSERWRGNDKK